MRYIEYFNELLEESPDWIVVNGKKHVWHDEESNSFFVCKSEYKNKTYAYVYGGRDQDFHLFANGVDLTSYIQKHFRDHIQGFPTHSDIAWMLHQIKPDKVTPLVSNSKMNREEFVFSGRSWLINGITYISFWNNKSTVDANKQYLDIILKSLKTTYDKCLFEFPDSQGDYSPYDSDTKINGKQKDAEKKLMAQLHTLPPGAKKWVRRGMSIKEMILMEDPDDITIPHDGELITLNWGQDQVTSVFSVIFDKQLKKKVCIVALYNRMGGLEKITSGDASYDSQIENVLSSVELGTHSSGETHKKLTHHDLLTPFVVNGRMDDPDAGFQDDGEDDMDDRGDYRPKWLEEEKEGYRDVAFISGRSWRFKNTDYFSFWNTEREVNLHKQYIDKIMDVVGAKMDASEFEFIDHPKKWIPYDDTFGARTHSPSSLSPDQILTLQKIQHLDPNAKKQLAALNKLPLDKLKLAADKFHIPLAKLRQQLHQGD